MLSSSQAILDRIEGWETRAMSRLFRFKRMEDETLAGYCTRAARTIWTKTNTSFLSETTPESIWRAMGWTCDPKPNAVLTTLRHAFAWRSTTWWQNTKATNMKDDLNNHTQNGAGTTEGVSGTKSLPNDRRLKNGAMDKGKGAKAAEDKRDFVTFALMSVKHSVLQ